MGAIHRLNPDRERERIRKRLTLLAEKRPFTHPDNLLDWAAIVKMLHSEAEYWESELKAHVYVSSRRRLGSGRKKKK